MIINEALGCKEVYGFTWSLKKVFGRISERRFKKFSDAPLGRI